MGASVLHEDAIFPVRKEGIPINIRNTNRPEDPGTMIVENTSKRPRYTITGVAGKKGFCAVNIDKAMMNSEVGFGRKVLEVFEKNGISFEHMPSGIDTMSVLVHQDEFQEKEQSVLAGIQRAVHPDIVTRVRSRSDRSRRTRHESNARDCCKNLRSTCTRKDQR